MSQNVIKLENVTKSYVTGDIETKVLKGVNLSVKKGDFIAITGRSGSGKSTLMNIIGLLDVPTSGKYVLNDTPIENFDEDQLSHIRSKQIGFVFQSFNLLSRSTTLENVILPSIYAGTKKAEREQRAKQILEKLGLGERMYNHPNQLSGGQQQRVAIARALMNDPEFILADEPTGNLDTSSGNDVMAILKDLNKQGKTIVLITHEMDVARQAKKIIKINDGIIM